MQYITVLRKAKSDDTNEIFQLHSFFLSLEEVVSGRAQKTASTQSERPTNPTAKPTKIRGETDPSSLVSTHDLHDTIHTYLQQTPTMKYVCTAQFS